MVVPSHTGVSLHELMIATFVGPGKECFGERKYRENQGSQDFFLVYENREMEEI